MFHIPNAFTAPRQRAFDPRALRGVFSLVLALASAGVLAAPVAFTNSYVQNFDSLGTSAVWTNDSTLAGWSLFNKDGNAVPQIAAGNGGSNTGSFYSFGTDASDRALGVLISGGAYFGSPPNNAVAGWMALALKNQSTVSIDALTLKFNGEQWRNGASTATQNMTLQWGIGDTFAGVTA